ncbi:MAG TPA: Maf family nucleotide pyrophosphatase [Aliidongia sp.]|uniref:Maf family protein n=1 Tax=Aliidongia sp. TaxID=1914230 RepID=UPI002DDD6EF5|nr:Maf family nucleotide pyrophosphatase [Aliidongia sp.]HEV2676862.1 Maf family nucleotide pyrophosphatase [Aliidongia sp.]
MSTPIILASASKIRLSLLQQAGLSVEVQVPAVDEQEMKASFQAERAPVEACAEALAELKAVRVSQRHPGALVIGADQMLDLNGIWFDKPADLDHARAHLQALRGQTHRLVTAAVVALNGSRIWHTIDTARLTMRPFSDAFLAGYLERQGPVVLSSVGAYQLEGLGAQLFNRIEGDFFTILGLPLLPLLGFLRGHGALPT